MGIKSQHHSLEPVEGNTSAPRKNPYDRWNECFMQLMHEVDNELDAGRDPFESNTVRRIAELAAAMFGNIVRESSRMKTVNINDQSIIKVSNAQKPSWRQITALAISLLGHFGQAVTSFVPFAGGYTGNKASMINGIGQGLGGVLGGGGSNALNMLTAWDNSKASLESNKLEQEKKDRDDLEQSRREQEQRRQKIEDALKQLSDQEFQVFEGFARPNS